MKQRSPLLPIFLVVLVDVMGLTIVYPLLPFYAERFGATPLIATTLVSTYAVCSLVSTPIIGRLSDMYGRKRLLLFSQAGTCIGFLVLGYSDALWMLYLGRILDGLTAGNLSTAQAYISDHTEPQNRTKAFGVIGVAFGIGFFIGPVLAAWLSKYGLNVPFLVAASLSVLSMVCTATLLSEDKGPPKAKVVKAPEGPGGKRPSLFDIATYTEYFRRPKLGSLYIQFFLFTFAFSAFISGFGLFAQQRFTHDGHPWTQTEVGYMYAYSGFLGIIIQGGLLGRLVKKLGEVKLALAGFVAAVIAYIVLGFTETVVLLVLVSTISGFGNGVLRPVITSQMTQTVGRHEQGVVLGISGSLSSLAMTMAPPSGGAFLNHGMTLEWTLVPATAAMLGLIAALATRQRYGSGTSGSNSPPAELPSDP